MDYFNFNVAMFKPAKLFILTALVLVSPISMTIAQEQKPVAKERVILVFDASGSMWGQIDGKAKIEIAKEAVSNLISDWPEQKEIGLMAYGHREKGDCNDIEMLIPVSKLQSDNFKKTVNKISPKGKTPLSEAVKRAANELKYTEEKATVVLLSDGIETCNLDPCEIGKSLESQGIDFTAHVIGFDVNKIEDQQGLKCLAENTGGKFISARDAKELNDALIDTVKEVPPTPTPEPSPSPVLPIGTISAPESATKGTMIKTVHTIEEMRDDLGYVYVFAPGKKQHIAYAKIDVPSTGNELSASLRLPAAVGEYEIIWKVADGIEVARTTIKATEADVEITAPDKAVIGTEIPLAVKAPEGLNGYIYLFPEGSDKQVTYVSVGQGTKDGYDIPKMRLPAVAGNYILKWNTNSRETLAEKAIEVTEASIALHSVDEALAGTEIDLSLTAPAGLSGYIYIFQPNKDSHISYVRVSEGKVDDYSIPKLRLPATPGDYVLKFKTDGREVLAEKNIKVVETKVSIVAVEEALAGTEISLGLTAPVGLSGYIYIFKAGSDKQISYVRVSEGKNNDYAIRDLRLPAAAGDYVLKFKTDSREVLAEKNIKITAVDVKIEAVDEAPVGTEISLDLAAPPGLTGYIYIYELGKDKHISYARVSEGKNTNYSVRKLRLPAKAGDYVLKFTTGNRETLAEKPLKLTPVEVEIVASDEGVVDSQLDLDLKAPAGLQGYIYIYKTNSDKALTYTRVAEGRTTDYSIRSLTLPSTPGDYILKFSTDAKEVMAEKKIKVVEAPTAE